MIQKRTVALAPAVLITAQLLTGVLFGFMGVVLATPLIVAIMVLIQMLYVQDLLDTEVRVLGDHDQDGGDPDSGPTQVQADREEREKETQ
jgi:predicted PurR-regulated permease PerM